MDIHTARELAEKEEIDYQSLLNILRHYSRPRDKISEWLKSGDLVRIKKGLYIFGKRVALSPYSSEILANLIYGPSAISFNYALSYYGLIPERVTTITSITNKRNKLFTTPVGIFSYRYINNNKYSVGIELLKNANQRHFLIASPEKAICDYISLVDKEILLTNLDDIHRYLLFDLRMDENSLRKLSLSKLVSLSEVYNDSRLELLILFLKKW